MRKFLGLLIFVGLLLTLNSCSENNRENDNVNKGENLQVADSGTVDIEDSSAFENIYDQFPKVDFEERDFTMLLCDSLDEEHYSESEIGEIFNDSIYRRNKKIEEDYNINIKFIIAADAPAAVENLKKSVMSQDNAYDIASLHAVFASGAMTSGIYTDWRTVPVINDNLHNSWWNKSVVENLSVGNKCFFIAGDVGYLYIAQTNAFIFNKKLFQDAGMENPYSKVKNGTWTYGAFKELIKNGNFDINGDGNLNIKDDRFGFVTMEYFTDTMYFYNFGGKVVEKDENDYPVLVLNSERNVAIIEAGYDWFINGESPIVKYTGNNDYTQEYAHIAFREDRAYFLGTLLKHLWSLRNMESEYGIVPFPKFDELQKDYISGVDGAATMLVLPTTSDGDFVGTIAEALARESSISVIPAYYETTLQQKFARDEETIDMLKVIRETATFDFAYIHNTGGGFARELLSNKSRDLASYYEKNEQTIQKTIDKLMQYIENLN